MNDCEYGFKACGCAALPTLYVTKEMRAKYGSGAPVFVRSETFPSLLPSEPAYIIGETEARRLVTAIDNCRPSDVIAVIQRQPWFHDVRRGVRATRHLKPTDYIKLSDRPNLQSEI